MKYIFLAAALSLASAAGAADFKKIQSEDEFRDLVVGKTLLFQGKDKVIIRANGKLGGNFGGQRLQGAWVWRDGFWCRTLTTHSKNTDCQLWETDGKDFRATRQRGQGNSFVYTQ